MGEQISDSSLSKPASDELRVDFSSGYVGWIGEYSQEDCVIAQILYDCGANPFVRTNVPQTLIVSGLYKSQRQKAEAYSGEKRIIMFLEERLIRTTGDVLLEGPLAEKALY